LRVVHVTPDWNLFSRLAPANQKHYSELLQHCERALDLLVTRMRNDFGIVARADLQSGTATRGILRAVESTQPQLVVLGARGEHEPRLAPAALGGTALKLIAQLGQPILLVRNTRAGAYRTSLAAVEEAREVTSRVVEWAAVLAPADLHIVRAFDVPYLERLRACSISGSDIDRCVSDARERVQGVADRLIESVVGSTKVRSHVVQGEPLAVVLTEIVRSGADILVVGKHDHRPEHGTHAVYGSVGLRMAYHAAIDALIVP